MQLEVQQSLYKNADFQKLMELANKRKVAVAENLEVVKELEKLLSNPSALDAQMKTLAVRRLMAANHVKNIHIAIDKAADRGEDHLTYSVHRTHSDETAQETVQVDVKEYITQSLMQSFYGIEWIENHKVQVSWGVKPTKSTKVITKSDGEPLTGNQLLYTSIIALLISIFNYILPFKPLAIGSLVTSALALMAYTIFNRSLVYSDTDPTEEIVVQWSIIAVSSLVILLLTAFGVLSLPAVLYSIIVVVALQLLCTRNRAMNNCIIIGYLLFASLAVYKTDKLRVDLPFQPSEVIQESKTVDTSEAEIEAEKVLSLMNSIDHRSLVLNYIVKQSHYEYIKEKLRYYDYLVDIKQDNISYGSKYTYISIMHKRTSSFRRPQVGHLQHIISSLKQVVLPVDGKATIFNSISIDLPPSIAKDITTEEIYKNWPTETKGKLLVTSEPPMIDPADRRYTYQISYPEQIEKAQQMFDLTKDLQPIKSHIAKDEEDFNLTRDVTIRNFLRLLPDNSHFTYKVEDAHVSPTLKMFQWKNSNKDYNVWTVNDGFTKGFTDMRFEKYQIYETFPPMTEMIPQAVAVITSMPDYDRSIGASNEIHETSFNIEILPEAADQVLKEANNKLKEDERQVYSVKYFYKNLDLEGREPIVYEKVHKENFRNALVNRIVRILPGSDKFEISFVSTKDKDLLSRIKEDLDKKRISYSIRETSNVTKLTIDKQINCKATSNHVRCP